MGGPHRAEEVEVHRGLPLLEGGVGKVRRNVPTAAGVVDQDARPRGLDELGDLTGVGHVDAHEPRSPLAGGQARGFLAGGFIEVGDHDLGAGLRERERDRPARAHGSARYHGDTIANLHPTGSIAGPR